MATVRVDRAVVSASTKRARGCRRCWRTPIPGIYPAVEHNRRRLYDGGLVATSRCARAPSMGARSLVLRFTAMITMRSQVALEAPLAAAQVPVV